MAVLNPPAPPGTRLWAANDPLAEPHPKSFELVCSGGAAVDAVGAESGVDHASLEPQASLLVPHPLLVGVGAGATLGCWAGCVLRLKTELICGGDEVADGFAAGAAGAGPPKSKRSPSPELAGAGAAGMADEPESNAPKPLEELSVRECSGG